MSSPGPPPYTGPYTGEYPPPYVPPDQVEAEPDEPPRPSWLRRHGLAIVAGLLVVVVAIGLTGFVTVRRFSEEINASLTCDEDEPPPTSKWFLNLADAYDGTELDGSPMSDPDLRFVITTIGAFLQQDSFALTTETDEDGVVNRSNVSGFVRDGTTVELRFGDGTQHRLTETGALTRIEASSFWVETCIDPAFGVLGGVGGDGTCVERSVRGRDEVITWSGLESDCGPQAMEPKIANRVVIRDGRFSSAESTFRTEDGSVSVTRTSAEQAEPLDDPPPWQVIPGWFVNLVDS